MSRLRMRAAEVKVLIQVLYSSKSGKSTGTPQSIKLKCSSLEDISTCYFYAKETEPHAMLTM